MIKVQIWKDYQQMGAISIIFYEHRSDGEYAHNFYTRQIKKLGDCGLIPDDFVLHIPWGIDGEVFKALAEAMDDQGVKTNNDAKIQGTLEATKYHLEDLRSLLKLEKSCNQPPK